MGEPITPPIRRCAECSGPLPARDPSKRGPKPLYCPEPCAGIVERRKYGEAERRRAAAKREAAGRRLCACRSGLLVRECEPGRVITCCDCKAVVHRVSHAAKRCLACAARAQRERDLAAQRRYRKRHAARRRQVPGQLPLEAAAAG